MISFILFGGTGDLAKRKIYPALFKLFLQEKIAFQIISVGRRRISNQILRDTVKESIENSEYSCESNLKKERIQKFISFISYFSTDVTNKGDMNRLKLYIDDLESKRGIINAMRFLFLSLPPSTYQMGVSNLSITNIIKPQMDKRLIIEKPFGIDMDSAIALQSDIDRYFQPDEIYRMDHFLYKEMTKNLTLIKESERFKPLWNSNYIKKFEIIIDENVGVLDRGNYFDGVGTVRDMFQNHILQLLLLIGSSSNKQNFLDEISEIEPENMTDNRIVLGQYIQNKNMGLSSYLQEKFIPNHSKTETMLQTTIFFKNTNWKYTPFYVRTGKALSKKTSIIRVHFHNTSDLSVIEVNEEKILIHDDDHNVIEELHYQQSPQVLYDAIILDALNKDISKFATIEEILFGWKLTEYIYKKWTSSGKELYKYVHGSHAEEIESWEFSNG
jgi:glucose-6-phosphate 1-dehydrogenase